MDDYTNYGDSNNTYLYNYDYGEHDQIMINNKVHRKRKYCIYLTLICFITCLLLLISMYSVYKDNGNEVTYGDRIKNIIFPLDVYYNRYGNDVTTYLTVSWYVTFILSFTIGTYIQRKLKK